MDQVTGQETTVMAETTRIQALHVVGQADLGLLNSGRTATPERQAALLAELAAMSQAERDAALAGTPLSRLVAGLRAEAADATGIQVDVVLLATRKGDRATQPIAAALKDHVASAVATARGTGSSRGTEQGVTVAVELVDEPTVAQARAWTREYLARRGLDERVPWALDLGAGASGMLFGVLFELLLAGIPVTLRAQDEAALEVRLDAATSEQTLVRWLVRHRFYDVLAPLDPVWSPLAHRQAVDVEWLLAPKAGSAGTGNNTRPLDYRARAVLFEAVQAAFAEGLARGEITDGAAARTWLRWVAATAPDSCRSEVLLMLGCVPGKRKPVNSARLAGHLGKPLASLLRQDVVDWHEAVKNLSHGGLGVVPEPPPPVLEQQHAWLHGQHEQPPLRAYPVWPLVSPAPRERHVLLLRVPPVRKDDSSQLFNDRTVDQIVEYLEAGAVTLVELTTPETVSTPPRTDVREVVRCPVDETEIDERPSLAVKYRSKLYQFLVDTRPELALVDEVAVVVPAGPKALVTAAMLAAVDFSLYAAAPVHLVDLQGMHGSQGPTATVGVARDTHRPLAALGLDGRLAALAGHALANLDLTIAEQLLRRGSTRLHDLALAVAELKRDAFGAPEAAPGTPGDPKQTSRPEILLACARLRLCGTLVAKHAWDAAYLVSSVLDHTFRMPPNGPEEGCDVVGVGRVFLTTDEGWVVGAEVTAPRRRAYLAPWEAVRMRDSPSSCSALRRLRNSHPLSHGIDPRRKSITVPTVGDVKDHLREAESELRQELASTFPWFAQEEADHASLVERHAELSGRLLAAASQLPGAP